MQNQLAVIGIDDTQYVGRREMGGNWHILVAEIYLVTKGWDIVIYLFHCKSLCGYILYAYC